MGDLRATAEVVRAGGSMGVAQVDVTAPTPHGEDTVAVGRASYRLFRGEEE
jgi:acyl-coenzyme A thioesterase PaaI-like protein